MRNITPADLQHSGFNLYGFRDFINPGNAPRLAQDAALQTVPNTTVPAELGYYYDDRVIEILTAPEQAKELLPERKPSAVNFTTSHIKFKVLERVGRTVPYGDFANHGNADINVEWVQREHYRFQTFIGYGFGEMAVSALAKLDLVSQKQRAVASVINGDFNRFYLYGVKGKDIYGFLNDPNLPTALTPISQPRPSGGPVIVWSGKTTNEIYQDVLKLYNQLVNQTKGVINTSSALTLAVSPASSVNFGVATDFNISVLDMLNKYFKNLTIVQLPELRSSEGVEQVYMYVREIDGDSTGELLFGEKLNTFPLFQRHSAYEQKFSASTLGCLIRYPLAFARMTGV